MSVAARFSKERLERSFDEARALSWLWVCWRFATVVGRLSGSAPRAAVQVDPRQGVEGVFCSAVGAVAETSRLWRKRPGTVLCKLGASQLEPAVDVARGEQGVLTSLGRVASNRVILRPSLLLSEKDAERIIEAVAKVVSALRSQ